MSPQTSTEAVLAALSAADHAFATHLVDVRADVSDHESRLRALEQWSAGLRGQLVLVTAVAGVGGSTLGAVVAGLVTYALTR